jgi:hypothetical protein
MIVLVSYRRDMAVGRKQVPATTGMFGRVSAAPEGGIYVRDPEAAEANAIRERVAAFEAAGEKVPKHLQTMLAKVSVGKNASEVKLVDAVTGEELSKVKHVDAQGFDEAGQPPPPARPPEPLKKGEEPENPLPDAEVGPIEADLDPEVVRPAPDPGPVPEGVPPLPDQVLESQEDAEARVASEKAEQAEAAQEAAAEAEKAAAKQEKAEAREAAKEEKKAGPASRRSAPRGR